jgi:predicted nucleic acid-binding protein
MPITIDTSAVIAVITGEAHREAILRITQDMELVAPGSLRWEVGNAFSAMFKRQRLQLQDAIRALQLYSAISVRVVDIPSTMHCVSHTI